MPFLTSAPAVTDLIHGVLETNKVALGLRGVWYSDQRLVPDYPAAMVQTLTKSRTYRALRQYELGFGVAITLLVGKVDSSEVNVKDTELLAEAVEDLLHTDKQFGGAVYDSFVSRIEPGRFLMPNSVMVKASRLTWVAESREVF